MSEVSAAVTERQAQSASMISHVHPKNCPDQKEAALDRKQHEQARMLREKRRQVMARAEWLEWYAPHPSK